MKTKAIIFSGIFFSLFFILCIGKGTQPTLKGIVHLEKGTYSGILSNADGPDMFKMVAIDSALYQMMDRYLEEGTQTITYGNTGEISENKLQIGGVSYQIGKGILYTDTDTLFKINDKTKLPSVCKYTRMLENGSGGEYASLERFYENGNEVTFFYFADEVYKMHLDTTNSQIAEYVDGKNYLFMEIIDPAPALVTTPVFDNGKKLSEFTILTPSHYIFTSADGTEYDVTYFTGDTESMVLLLNSDRKKCFLLPQTEAWAKGADYSDGHVTWSTQGDKATLSIGDKEVRYTQMATHLR